MNRVLRRSAAVALGAYAMFGCSGGGLVDSASTSAPAGSAAASERVESVDGDLLEGAPDASPESAEATLAFLELDGAPLLTMHGTAAPLTTSGRPGRESCAEVGERLEASLTSEEALLLIGLVPDEVLRAALFQERTALGVVLTSCVLADGSMDEAMIEALVEAAAAVDDRIRHLEEQR